MQAKAQTFDTLARFRGAGRTQDLALLWNGAFFNADAEDASVGRPTDLIVPMDRIASGLDIGLPFNYNTELI